MKPEELVEEIVYLVENSGDVVARSVPNQPPIFPRHRYRYPNLKTKNACVE